MKYTRIVFAVLLSLLTASKAFSNDLFLPNNRNIYGLWLESNKQKVAVLVDDCDGQLCGRIVWLKEAYSANGKPKLDAKNPNKTLRDTPRCGLTILSGFTLLDKNYWGGGTIYNPSDGDTYRSTIRITREGTLEVRGYVGIPLFGKTTTWLRPSIDLPLCF